MKKKIILMAALALGLQNIQAQEVTVDDPWKDYPASKKELYKDYSRWSVGVNVGVPYFSGDFRSLGRNNYNFGGFMIGVQGGYQINPLFGVRLSFDYGFNRAGSQRAEDDFVLLPNANAYYNVDFPEGAARYRDLYSKIQMFNIGLNWETNLVNLFKRGDGDCRWAVIAAPGIYLQKFSPEVRYRENDNRFAEKVSKKVNLGLGGDLAVRYRVNHDFDVQLKGGMMWLNNKDFDGVRSINTTKHNTAITVQAGLIWKIGNGKHGSKKDNLMYAPGYLPMWKRATRTVTKTVHDTIYIEKEVLSKSKEVAVCKFPSKLPAIYFERGKSKIDTDKYAIELFTIAKAMKDCPDATLEIYGYADHTGGEAINKKITEKRAEALKAWLVKVGIEPERITTFGLGKDQTIEREKRFSIDARRSEPKGK